MKLLFIAPIYFNYQKIIKRELDSHYDKVFFRSEVPFNSSVKYYALRRLTKSLAQKSIEHYNRYLIDLIIDEKIERIFIIRGYGLTEHFFQSVQMLKNRVEIFNYQWDSLQNNPKGEMIGRYANKNFSFDLKDSQTNPSFTHLPLFSIWDSILNLKSPSKFKQDIDVLFVGGYHSERHLIVDKVQKECKAQGLKLKHHIYLPIGSYIRDRLTSKEINLNDVCFRKLSRKTYYNLLCRSRSVLDIQSDNQSGATIRTFEALSLSRKLISTNIMLQKEQFYSSNNIQIWSPKERLDINNLLSLEFDHSKDPFLMNVKEWLRNIGLLNS